VSAEESRAAFEAHARAQGYGAHLKRHDVGIYESQLIEGMWRGWTAREPEVQNLRSDVHMLAGACRAAHEAGAASVTVTTPYGGDVIGSLGKFAETFGPDEEAPDDSTDR